MGLAQSCVSGAQRGIALPSAGPSPSALAQLNVFAREADVAVEMAAAIGKTTYLLMCPAKGFWQPRKQPPLVQDSAQVDMQVISST